MKTRLLLLQGILLIALILNQATIQAQSAGEVSLPIKFEELTAPDFIRAVDLSNGICIIPLGIIEKHAAHLPLGTDLMIAREVATRAAAQEYSVVFPQYYAGQINEAKHQPGTIAYSHKIMWNLLDETCKELVRNGMNKIILVNGHGGNNSFLQYFCQVQLAERKDYCVIVFTPKADKSIQEEIEKLQGNNSYGHAAKMETSMIQVIQPELVHIERANDQSGENLERLKDVPNTFTAIWWYASFPNHYEGDGSNPSKETAEMVLDHRASQLAELIRILKKNNDILDLQDQFYNESEQPLKTKQ